MSLKYEPCSQCYCPTKHSDAWKEAYTCHALEPQIERDFEPFPEISRGMIDDALRILQVLIRVWGVGGEVWGVEE